jgi:hypothetical protein
MSHKLINKIGNNFDRSEIIWSQSDYKTAKKSSMYKDSKELLGRRRDAYAHEFSGALVGCHANFTAPLHRLSKIPRLFDVSGTS